MTEMTDDELYARWAEVRGSQEPPDSEKVKAGKRAGAILFKRYFDPIQGYFRKRLGDDIQDVVSETLQAALYGNFRGDAAFRSFLYGIAFNRLMKEFKRRSKRADFDPSVSSLNDVGPSITYVLDKNKVRGLVAAALRRIPIDNQQAIELYFLEGRTGPEVAAFTGISLPALRNRLRRGLDKIRVEIAAMEATREEHEASLAEIEAWASSLGERVDDTAP